MRLAHDEKAASPLVVIVTFVAATVLVTALGYALLFDRPEARLQLVALHEGEAVAFEVAQAGGGLAWGDVEVRLLDRAGTDQAELYLQVPSGEVGVGDRVTVHPNPPAGGYLVVVLLDGVELSRLTVDL